MLMDEKKEEKKKVVLRPLVSFTLCSLDLYAEHSSVTCTRRYARSFRADRRISSISGQRSTRTFIVTIN